MAMKTEHFGATTTISFSQEDIDALLEALIRDGVMDCRLMLDESQIHRYLTRGIQWMLENSEAPDSYQASLILQRMFKWKDCVCFGGPVPDGASEFESGFLKSS